MLEFRNEIHYLVNWIDISDTSNDDVVAMFRNILNNHAPLKQKYVRSNDNPFVTKELRKEHMLRSKLRNKYYQEKTKASALAYRRQWNKRVSLLKKAIKTYFGNLNPSLICDNKDVWKTIKSLFCEQKVSTNNNILIENNDIVDDDKLISEISF